MLSVSLEQQILQYYEDLDSSFSLKCAIMWRHGERESVVGLSCPPQDYDTPERYYRSVSAVALVKKLKGLLPNDSDRRKRTVEKWQQGEVSCYRANQRLYPYLVTHLDKDERIAQHLAGVREVVEELIGFGPPSHLEMDVLEGRFGPGTTFADRGSPTVPDKMNSNPTLTSDCVWFLPQFLQTAWGRFTTSERELVFVRGNRYATAPKTSLIDRSIAIEPGINVFFQLAIGSALRRALKARSGWDLNTAQAVHRATAQRASVTREFATLDLSNASDTVAYNLVKLLLPHRWFGLMEAVRSPFTSHPNDSTKWVKLEKFSSMGNGYTFELETILFAAVSLYVTRICGAGGILGWDTFVFGDDIIVRDGVVREVVALLNYLGFELNMDKSFYGMSPFRESCGADFYVGANVRPQYLKEDPRNVQDGVAVANRFSAGYDTIHLMGGSVRARAWNLAVSAIPLPYRHCRGPRALGDAVIWEKDERRWRAKWRHGIRYVKGIKAGDRIVVPFGRYPPDVVLACAVYGTGNEGTPERGRIPDREGVTPRDGVRSHVVGWLAYS